MGLSRKVAFQIFIAASVVLSLHFLISHSRCAQDTKLFQCDDFSQRTYHGHRGNFLILYNYFKASATFRCDESITYTTHADWTYLNNLISVLDRWRGPISIALYSPGTDFNETVVRIQYLRECKMAPLIKKFVTFHVFFDQANMPTTNISLDNKPFSLNCELLRNSLKFGEKLQTYKTKKNLTYPVNIARNIAREMSTTHFVFPSDIELYPTPNLIPEFLEMFKRRDPILYSPAPKVFVLPIFEVDSMVTVPCTKKELIHMIKNKTAVPFHKFVCPKCHNIPKIDDWYQLPATSGIRVFHIAKRYDKYKRWEPIFIGTKLDPYYDERLSWEGRQDKMSQGYVLCVLDYEFHILDNAFLVHKPGIKRKNANTNKKFEDRQQSVIKTVILPELQKVYGNRSGCAI